MFYYIQGIVAHVAPYLAVLDCSGVGYACKTTNHTLAALTRGKSAKLYTHLYVREEIMELYGFISESELNCFEMLIGVSGVGPKAALAILSSNTPEGLATAIVSGNEKALTSAPGIGKKIAQRIILELKDKLKLEDAFEMKLAHQQEEAAEGASDLRDSRQEAVEALVALGYSSADALRAVRKVPEEVQADDVEAILRAALKNF